MRNLRPIGDRLVRAIAPKTTAMATSAGCHVIYYYCVNHQYYSYENCCFPSGNGKLLCKQKSFLLGTC